MSDKFKINRNLATVLDAEGREVKVKPREDIEQDAKLQEITDLLVAAGYFRARIKGLSAFDKVVGGIVWCIDTCDVDIDVDLLFQDDLTIGQKISLTEKIVAVLPKIKCPHGIEPHQIQGLDFIHIFPVIQWLVKRAMETRGERSEYLKDYAVKQFQKDFHLPEDEAVSNFNMTAVSNILKIQQVHCPVRKFRRTGKPPSDLITRVETTLLEYGDVLSFQKDVEGSGEQNETLNEESRKEILKSLISTSIEEGRLAPNVIGNIVSLQANEIVKAAAEYADLQAESETSSSKRIKRLKEKIFQSENKNNDLKNTISKAEETLASIVEKNEAFKNKETYSEEEQKRYEEIDSLLKKNEELKSQEIKFKENCKAELVKLQDLVRESEEAAAELQDNSTGIDQQMALLEEKVNSTRLELGKRTRAVSALERQLDQVPGHAELAQYQLRFMELYSLVSAKHIETKQFYNRYNTLSDTHRYLDRELSLLNSITDNFKVAMSNSSAKQEFMNQLDKIVEEIQSNKSKVEFRRNKEKNLRDELEAELSSLQEKQRQYVAALKQLSFECKNG